MRLRFLTLATLVAATLGVLSPADAAPTTPKVGQCHQLTARQAAAVADSIHPVGCGKRHNLITVAVVTSPTSLAGLSEEEHSDVGAKLCNPAFKKALGRTETKQAQTAYWLYFFSPTEAQIAAGARWIRCDVGLQAGRRLLPLPKRLHRPVVPRRLTDDVRRCLTRSGAATVCSHAHVYRSVSAFRAAPGADYPTADQFIASAARRCPQGWRYATWPGPNSWAAGDRAVVCYERTKK